MTEKLSFLGIEPAVQRLPPRILLYGRNGIGKSTFASAAPHPVFIELDGNIDTLPTVSNKKLGRIIDVNSPQGCEQLTEFLKDLYSADHDFKTLVLDSLSTFEKMATLAVCKRNNVDSLAQIPYGKGPDQLIPYFEKLQLALWKLWEKRSMAIVMLAHPKEATFANLNGTSYSHYRINLHEKCSEILRNPCSAVLFVEDEVDLRSEDAGFNRTIKKATGSTRVMRTDGGAGFLAKNTYNLPKALPLSWSILDQYIQKYFEKSSLEKEDEA